jgi:hypothetical protein
LDVYLDRRRRNDSFMWSVVLLIGHLAGTVVIFAGLLLFAWLSGWFLSWLNQIHPFADNIYHLATRAELWIFYTDTSICGLVIVVGVFRFLVDIFSLR